MNNIGFLSNNQVYGSSGTIVPSGFTHSCAIGQTGCGKTTTFIYPNIENRIEQNHSLVVFDYKGKEHTAVKYLALKNNRLDDVFEIGKYWAKSINIIKYMTEADLENFLGELYGLRGSENEYWGVTAVNVSLVVLNTIGAIEDIVKASKESNTKMDFEKAIENFTSYAYPHKKTLHSLSLVASSVDSLKVFIQKLDSLYEVFITNLSEELELEHAKTPKRKLFAKFKKLIYSIETFNIISRKAKKNLEAFGNLNSQNTSKTIQTVLLSISTPLLGIANKKWLNNDDFDIIENINNGKIIIINTKTFSDAILSSFSNSVFNELSKRVIKSNIKPVSIFIDEVQRVVSNNFDLPIDILREAKVELFLAFQNNELLIDKVGEIKFQALIQNIGHTYIYKNKGYYNEFDLSEFEIFEYLLDTKNTQKVNRIKPVFLEENKLFDVELQYQKKLNIHKMFGLDKDDYNKIILHDENEINKLNILLANNKGQISVKRFFNQDILQSAKRNFYNMINDLNIKSNLSDEEDDILKIFRKRLSYLERDLSEKAV